MNNKTRYIFEIESKKINWLFSIFILGITPLFTTYLWFPQSFYLGIVTSIISTIIVYILYKDRRKIIDELLKN